MHLPLAAASLALALCLGAPAAAAVTFDSSHEGGNATAFRRAVDGAWEFRIEPDTGSTDRQWFDFRVRGAAGQTLTFRLLDTDRTNVTNHWPTALPVATADGTSWAHVAGPTSATRTTFTFAHAVASDDERIAFHFPYTWSTLRERLDVWDDHPHVQRTTIGTSIEGRPIELLRVADPDGPPPAERLVFWFTARQHPGEVPSSFMMDALLDTLLADTTEGRVLRRQAIVYAVPMVNPDGVVAGNYRDNAAGVNLNRVWDGRADARRSPEVLAVERAIEESLRGRLRYAFYGDLHATSGPQPHFAFHSSNATQPPLFPDLPAYHAESRRFLALVGQHAPHFNPTRGSGPNNNLAVASHDQRMSHGALAFTFEGVYSQHHFGPTPKAYLVADDHRLVGTAIAKALVTYYELDEATTTPEPVTTAGEQ